jgi:hypothetical protein
MLEVRKRRESGARLAPRFYLGEEEREEVEE